MNTDEEKLQGCPGAGCSLLWRLACAILHRIHTWTGATVATGKAALPSLQGPGKGGRWFTPRSTSGRQQPGGFPLLPFEGPGFFNLAVSLRLVREAPPPPTDQIEDKDWGVEKTRESVVPAESGSQGPFWWPSPVAKDTTLSPCRANTASRSAHGPHSYGCETILTPLEGRGELQDNWSHP